MTIIYFADLCKLIETYICARKKHSFASYSAAKHPRHSKFAITGIREKPVNFFYGSACASILVFAVILPTQIPLQKFPFLFIIIIPCLNWVTSSKNYSDRDTSQKKNRSLLRQRFALSCVASMEIRTTMMMMISECSNSLCETNVN